VIRVSGKVDEWTFFSKTWLSWELLRGAYTPLLGAHDRQESLLFAKKIERHALGGKWFCWLTLAFNNDDFRFG
jgi:hypothetical protein